MNSLSASGRGALAMLLIVVLCSAALLRLYAAFQPGLWMDEVFSVAIATGHSLEHPAAEAVPGLGDYVEAGGLPPSAWRRYMTHDSPPAGLARVVRAVFLSDTNPPLYYLLLSWWMRFAGASDAALRVFSAVAAIACMPVLWQVGREVGGRRLAVFACVLFALSPMAIYYSTEGRMYSLTWLLGLALAWSTLAIRRRGARPGLVVAWVTAGAAALLTHYFLAFVWCACLAWGLLTPGRSSRRALLLVASASLVLVLPWYVQVPETLARWRVTAGWLDSPLGTRDLISAPLNHIWGMISPGGDFRPKRIRTWAVILPLILAAILAFRPAPRALFTSRRLLPWIWLAASIIGVIVFDLLRGTHAALYARYALPGLPAAFLLLGLFLSRAPARLAPLLLVLVLSAWAYGSRGMFRGPPRPWQPFPEIAAHLDASTGPGDLIIVRSIPSGVLGVPRYMRSETPVAPWVDRLREDPAGQLETLTRGACRIVLVSVHASGRTRPEEWLHTHAELVAEHRVRDVPVLYFRRSPPAGLPPEACPTG